MVYHRKHLMVLGALENRGRASEPDRCFEIVVNPRRSRLTKGKITLKFYKRSGKSTKTGVEWECSTRIGQETGFLDLPKEIRDMIYDEICTDLKRQGLRWESTTPHKGDVKQTDPGIVTNSPSDRPVKRLEVFADCAIMRTCRQLHSEFATVLYSQPIQLQGIQIGINEIPFPPLYAHLVRLVLTLPLSVNRDTAWRERLQIADGLYRLFPRANILRLGWWASHNGDPGVPPQNDPMAWASAVEVIEKSIKSVKGKAGTLPHNLEMVRIRRTHKTGQRVLGPATEVESTPSPVAEVISRLRGKQPPRMGLRTRKA